MNQIRIGLLLLAAMTAGTSRAGLIEELLARPAIQALLSKQAEVKSTLLRCGNPYYLQRNAEGCRQAEEAQRLAAMPIELRLLMSKPQMAASLRELCIAVQGAPLQNSWLCAELYRAEAGFRQMADQQRMFPGGVRESQQIN